MKLHSTVEVAKVFVEFEPKFAELFPLNSENQAALDVGLKPLQNETKSFEAFQAQVQARTSASAENYNPTDLIQQGLAVLKDSSRDLKVFTIVADVALSPPIGIQGPEILSLFLATNRALGAYWSNLHPKADSKGGIRSRLLLIQEISKSFQKHMVSGESPLAPELTNKLKEALNSIASVLTSYGEPWSELASTFRETADSIGQDKKPAVTQAPASGRKPGPPSPSHPNPRELRNRLLALLADLPAEPSGLEEPIAYNLRRKAAFSAFEGEVGAKDGRTELTDIPEERIQEIRAAIDAPTLESLNALEQTLLSRPLWLTGHRYAFEMAEQLGGGVQAYSIWTSTVHEVERFHSNLNSLSFANGLAFSDATTAQWLKTPPGQANKNVSTSLDTEESGNILAELELNLRAHSQNPPGDRQDLVTQIAVAQALASLSHDKMAATLARMAQQILKSKNLTDWETDLIRSLDSLL